MAPPKPNKPAMDPDVSKYLLSTAQSAVPLQISTSSMEGAGLGLFVTEAVADATEVFRIEQPLLSAVDQVQLPTTCDHCLRRVGVSRHANDSNSNVKRLLGSLITSWSARRLR